MRSALRSALAMKVREQKLVIVDAIDIADGKTKSVVSMLEALGVSRALIVTEAANAMLERAAG